MGAVRTSVIFVPGNRPISRKRMKAEPCFGNSLTRPEEPTASSDSFKGEAMAVNRRERSDAASDHFHHDELRRAIAECDARAAKLAKQRALTGNFFDHRRFAEPHLS